MRTAVLLVASVTLLLVGADAGSSLLFEEWVARLDGPSSLRDEGWSCAIDDEGSVYVTGFCRNAPQDDYVTIKYDVYGNEEWVATYHGGGDDEAAMIRVDQYGNAYVTGKSVGSGTSYDIVTVKYDTDGNEEWVARYNGPGNGYDWAWGLAVDNDGNVYAAGRSYGSGTGYDYATIKYDSDGNEVWVARYDGPPSRSDIATGLVLDAAGNVYVTGKSVQVALGESDYATIKYDSDGNELWVATYDGTGGGADMPYWGVAVDDSGNVCVTGESDGGSSGLDYATVKYDADGNEEWVARYDGTGNGEDNAYALTVDADGNVYITGRSTGDGTFFDYATVKYDADGNEEWVARHAGPADTWDCCHQVSVDADGNVYVTGMTGGDTSTGTGADYGTIMYGPDGTEEWVALYNGIDGGTDYAWGMALDDVAGALYVTGYSDGDGTDLDVVTIKYQVGVGIPDDERDLTHLHPVTPNPVRSRTTVRFDVPSGAPWARLAIYNVRGQRVRTLVDGPVAPGRQAVSWDGTDGLGNRASAGVYFVRLGVGRVTETRKIAVVR